MKNAEVNNALEDDEFDDDIEDQFKMLEAEMLGNKLQEFDNTNLPVQNDNLESPEKNHSIVDSEPEVQAIKKKET